MLDRLMVTSTCLSLVAETRLEFKTITLGIPTIFDVFSYIFQFILDETHSFRPFLYDYWDDHWAKLR